MLGSEEQTQNVDCFTQDGDLVLSDDANIPESARAIPTVLQAPVLNMKCKNMVDVSFASNRFKVQRKSQFFTVDENNKRSVRTEEQE